MTRILIYFKNKNKLSIYLLLILIDDFKFKLSKFYKKFKVNLFKSLY